MPRKRRLFDMETDSDSHHSNFDSNFCEASNNSKFIEADTRSSSEESKQHLLKNPFSSKQVEQKIKFECKRMKGL